MHVRIISLGTNWWTMHSRDLDDPYCFRRRAAWFNSTGLKCGQRLRLNWIYPGQLRFNLTSGFEPEFRLRAIGRTFWCSGPNRYQRKIHLLVVRPVKSASPEMYLVTLNDAESNLGSQDGSRTMLRRSRSVCARRGTKRCC
jgi:hypothetical protein